MRLFRAKRRPSRSEADLVDRIAAIIFEAEWEPLEWSEDTTGSDKRDYRMIANKVIGEVRSNEGGDRG